MNDSIAEILTPVVAALGLELEAIELNGSSPRQLILTVDADEPISLDSLTDVSRKVSEALDSSDVMGAAPYSLEVSSRCVDRPLVLARHWRRNIDRLVAVEQGDGERVTGRIVAVNDTQVTLRLGDSDLVCNYSDIERAVVQIELNRKDR
jgi:ribosome maturation factor RimP